jgi:hypothetical protein
MAEIFSAYARPQRNVGRQLANVVMALAVLFVCLQMTQVISPPDTLIVSLTGVLVWGLAMLSAMRFPNRVSLSFAVGGALLVGVGLLAVAYGPACSCEHSSGLLPSIRRTLTGEPQQFTLSCF